MLSRSFMWTFLIFLTFMPFLFPTFSFFLLWYNGTKKTLKGDTMSEIMISYLFGGGPVIRFAALWHMVRQVKSNWLIHSTWVGNQPFSIQKKSILDKISDLPSLNRWRIEQPLDRLGQTTDTPDLSHETVERYSKEGDLHYHYCQVQKPSSLPWVAVP